jgi:hypothetical protein
MRGSTGRGCRGPLSAHESACDHQLVHSPLPSREDGSVTEPEDQILLAEFTALRAEIERRTTIQWNIFALQIASAGAVGSLAIASASQTVLLLVIPLSSYMFGSRYILHDYHIKLIHKYIRDTLSVGLRGKLAWERHKEEALAHESSRGWFTATAWKLTHPTRLAFEGVAILALASVALAALYNWGNERPSWYLILAFILMWLLGVLVTYFLHRSFNQAS